MWAAADRRVEALLTTAPALAEFAAMLVGVLGGGKGDGGRSDEFGNVLAGLLKLTSRAKKFTGLLACDEGVAAAAAARLADGERDSAMDRKATLNLVRALHAAHPDPAAFADKWGLVALVGRFAGDSSQVLVQGVALGLLADFSRAKKGKNKGGAGGRKARSDGKSNEGRSFTLAPRAAAVVVGAGAAGGAAAGGPAPPAPPGVAQLLEAAAAGRAAKEGGGA